LGLPANSDLPPAKPALKAKLLEDRWLRDTLHRESVATEGSSWISGRKSAAIECLAEFDREAAFGAATRALESADGHDRERYPYLLREIDVEQAVPLLLDHLATERSDHVRFAIGRALSTLELEDELRKRIASPTESIRKRRALRLDGQRTERI
jgi:HEAT repeat protein